MRYMFTMMNNARLVGRASRAWPSPSGPTSRPWPTPRSAARAGPSARRAGRAVADHRAPRRAPHAAHHEGPHRGHARPHLPQRPRPSTSPRTTPTRRCARRNAGARRPAHADRPRRGAPTWASRSPRSPSRSTAAWATSRRPASPSTSATPASRRSTRAPTASRPWTSSAASCRCGAAAWSPSSSTGWRPRPTTLAGSGDEDLAAIGARPGRGRGRLPGGDQLAHRARAWPTPTTRWPAPRPTCACSATVTGGWVLGPAGAGRPRGDGGATSRQAFLEAKVTTARFFAEHLLPPALGLVHAGHQRRRAALRRLAVRLRPRPVIPDRPPRRRIPSPGVRGPRARPAHRCGPTG